MPFVLSLSKHCSQGAFDELRLNGTPDYFVPDQ
jgi:hypothetical protein